MGKLAKFIFFYTDEDKGVKPVPVEKNAIGNPIRIIDALVNPVVNLKAYFDPVQSGTGDPSPDNVRPISGWTECKVTRTGKNVFTARNGTDSSNGTTVVFESVDGIQMITVSGTPSATTYFDIDTDVVFNLTDYGFSVGGNIPNGCSFAYVSNLGDGQYQGVRLRVTSSFGGYGKFYLGLFEKSKFQSYTIDLNGTVYGGTLDVTSGKLTVDRAIVDLGTLDWSYNSNWNGAGAFYCNQAPEGIKKDNPSDIVPNAVCSIFKVYNRDYLYKHPTATGLCIPNNTGQVSIRDAAYDNATVFKTAMSGVQLCYELGTPIVYDLTPTEITTLLGTNNIWANTNGNLELTYLADENAS